MKKLHKVLAILLFTVNNIILPQTPQDNPYYQYQYELFPVNVPEFWQSAGYGNSDVVIAVLGMGVKINHPDLNANIFVNNYEIPNNQIDDDQNGYIDDYTGWNTITNSSNVLPDYDNEDYMHETYIAGILAAELNYEGIVGIAPHCKILPVKCYNPFSNPNLSQQIADAKCIAKISRTLSIQQQPSGISYQKTEL